MLSDFLYGPWLIPKFINNCLKCYILGSFGIISRRYRRKSEGKLEASISSVQPLSCVWLFVTPWTAAHRASLSITNPKSLLKLTFIELVMPSNHLILCHPFLLLLSIFPSIKVFSMSQFFTSGGQSIGASASVLPMNIQDWFPLGWTGWISLLFKGLSRVFSNTTVQKASILQCSAFFIG